jgi:hypothetical protein
MFRTVNSTYGYLIEFYDRNRGRPSITVLLRKGCGHMCVQPYDTEMACCLCYGKWRVNCRICKHIIGG